MIVGINGARRWTVVNGSKKSKHDSHAYSFSFAHILKTDVGNENKNHYEYSDYSN